VQKGLSDDGVTKNLSQYSPALGTVWKALTEEERKHCEQLAVEWNKMQIPEDVQRKWVSYMISDLARDLPPL